MGGAGIITDKSQELMKEFLNTVVSRANAPVSVLNIQNRTDLVKWLADGSSIPEGISKNDKEKIEFLLASLQAELLNDLFLSMQENKSFNGKTDDEPPFDNQAQFVLLAIAGTLLAACEGFDSISSLMSVLSFPAVTILLAGIAFSALSIFVFYGFDLVQVSQNLGIKLKDAPQLLDVYLMQMEKIKAMRRIIESCNLVTLSKDDLERYALTVVMLQKRLHDVRLASEQFDLALNSDDMKITEAIVSWGAGLLFFGSGFFAGQSVAVFFLELFMASSASMFWPVILFSLVVGVAAFAIYWNVERVGVKALISTWFGLEEEKIKTLCDSEKLANEHGKLGNLLEHIISVQEVVSQLASLKEQHELRQDDYAKLIERPSLKVSTNIYSFHLRPDHQEGNHSDRAYDEVSGCNNN